MKQRHCRSMSQTVRYARNESRREFRQYARNVSGEGARISNFATFNACNFESCKFQEVDFSTLQTTLKRFKVPKY